MCDISRPAGDLYDTLILGSGPAGLTAAIYAARTGLRAATIEKNMMSGGQIVNTSQIDNYPGLRGMSGFDLGQKFREDAEASGAPFIEDNITEVSLDGPEKVLTGESGETYRTRTLIIAAGARHSELGVPGEAEFAGRGVSYCAVCDGAFFRGKTVAVIGGGDTALMDAIYLTRICAKVYVIHRRDAFRGAKVLQDTLLDAENAEVLWDTVVDRVAGDGRVDYLVIRNKKSGEVRELPACGVFIAVGIVPESEMFRGKIRMDERGFIEAGENGETSVPGVYAAGDVRTKQLRQVITAAADGANCVQSVSRYLESLRSV